MKDKIVFDINQVIEVFTLRVEGKSHEAIGAIMGCSGGYVAKVLSRENYGHFNLDPVLVDKAVHATIKRKPAVRGKKKTKANTDPVKALAAYGKKVLEVAEAHEVCVDAGLSVTAIHAFYNALVDLPDPQD